MVVYFISYVKEITNGLQHDNSLFVLFSFVKLESASILFMASDRYEAFLSRFNQG